MTVIRVNPHSVHAYGSDAQQRFDLIRTELVALVDAVVGVRYFGPNAVSFKTQAGQLSADFANQLNQGMGATADAIKASTSAIAASLGGAPVVIAVNGQPISPPAVETVDYVDVDTSALDSLQTTVDRHFTNIADNLDGHLAKLLGTDWQGNAREQAVSAVQGFTTSAKSNCAAAQQSLKSFINQQVQSVTQADR